MAKKKAAKKKAAKRQAKKAPKAHKFGHLDIPRNARITDGATVANDDNEIDSRKCWEEWDGE